MTEHSMVIAGGGPTGLMLAGELALAGVDVAIVERRADQKLAGSRAGGLHARTIEVLDQRGIADRFLSEGQAMQVAADTGLMTMMHAENGPAIDVLAEQLYQSGKTDPYYHGIARAWQMEEEATHRAIMLRILPKRSSVLSRLRGHHPYGRGRHRRCYSSAMPCSIA